MKKVGYKREEINRIAEKLKSMPDVLEKKEDLSKKEAIHILSKEITELKKRGYTLRQIAESLKGEGIDISTPTLKLYLRKKRPAKKTKEGSQVVSEVKEIPGVNDDEEQKKGNFNPNPDSEEI